MSYTVLAVKWRPKRFDALIGQTHVVQALANSLAQERLHHAYLFSGTRGVGKTTVARILAKALNCDEGVVAEPCGECAACTAIDAGRFVDLIEVDAASRTRVDDTRELLDNVQYAPTSGRYKVYLIDEVHMLSNHSFNALLKTLEEPPPHVKFLLATTDPQKLPVTVLSRCLQFHLKKLTVPQIVEQLETICKAESVTADAEGLRAIARAADGSMRDALSLLDQAIAFSDGQLEGAQVNAMLGTIDRDQVTRILQALAANDGAALLQASSELDELAADFGLALDELLHALQQLAVMQLVSVGAADEQYADLEPLAEQISAEDVQLYYHIALNGRRDLQVARDARVSFEMTLLRMLAFRPATGTAAGTPPTTPPGGGRPGGNGGASPGGSGRSRGARAALERAGSAPGAKAQAKPQAALESETPAQRPRLQVVRNESNPVPGAAEPAGQGIATAPHDRPAATVVRGGSREAQQPAAQPVPPAPVSAGADDSLWADLLTAADIRGMARQLADNCELQQAGDRRWQLVLSADKTHLLTDQIARRLEAEISRHLDRQMALAITPGQPPRPTPAEVRAANENERMRRAREAVEQDSNIQALKSTFDAVVEADSISPLEEGEG